MNEKLIERYGITQEQIDAAVTIAQTPSATMGLHSRIKLKLHVGTVKANVLIELLRDRGVID